ncbi:MAG: type I-B CRISPR-associated protein Cas5b [Candidatus Helarchaeota archaeon]
MEALCFDVKAPFAIFRVPSTTRGFLTFPFPPRTALLGLIGGILGIPRNEIYLEDHPLNDLDITLMMMSIPNVSNFRTSQIQTHDVLTFKKIIRIYLPKPYIRGREASFNSPQTLTYLSDVHYRIFVLQKHENESKLSELESRIKEHKYVYLPYLGRANLLASIDYIDTVELKEINNKKKTSLHSICAAKGLDKIEEGNFTIITNVPMSYEAKKDRKKGILLKPGYLTNVIYFKDSIEVIPKFEIYEIVNTKLDELKNKRIQFLPYQEN